MNEQELWQWMMEGNYPQRKEGESACDHILRSEHRTATATLTKDVVGKRYKQYWDQQEPQFDDVTLKAGCRVKVVMASRFGDVGITDDLTVENGYIHRTLCTESGFPDGKIHQPSGLLTDISTVGKQ